MLLAISVTQGVDRAVVGANVMVLELCGGYYLLRLTLRNSLDVATVGRVLASLIAIDGALSLLDVICDRAVLLETAGSLTGFVQAWQRDYRHGYMRALGMQEHPIALGTLCVFGTLLAFALMRGTRRIVTCMGCLIGVVTSNSSAPITGLMLACTFLVYHRLTARLRWRWQLLMLAAAGLFITFSVVHGRPIEYLIDHATSNPADGYYRLLTWSVVGPIVLANPLFGLGLENDFLHQFNLLNTIDSFWLCSAVNFGLPGACLFALLLLSSCWRPVQRSGVTTGDSVRLGRVLGIIVFLYIYIGMTVHFWGCLWILIGVFSALRVNLSECGGLVRPIALKPASRLPASRHSMEVVVQ